MKHLVELKQILLRQGHFSLEVAQLILEPGRLYSLEGENGSGKSTLLRLLALLRKPERGQMRITGQEVVWKKKQTHRLRQQVTLVEQNPILFSGTVEQNLSFGLKVRRVPGCQRQERIAQALAATGLHGFMQRLAGELSGGEQRRVALARALVLQPQLLLLDEPTANLDAGQVAALERVLVALPGQGISVVIATHDRRQPERLAGESLRLCNGQLLQGGSHSAPLACCYPRLKRIGETL